MPSSPPAPDNAACGGLSVAAWASDPAPIYPRPVDRMPQPGDPYSQAFIVEPNECWRIVHDRQGQATHCLETTTFTGRWYSPRHDGTWWCGAVPTTLMG
jgi:hypothetical protein